MQYNSILAAHACMSGVGICVSGIARPDDPAFVPLKTPVLDMCRVFAALDTFFPST